MRQDHQDGAAEIGEQTEIPVPATPAPTASRPPITRDALRARLGVSNQLASDLLRHVRTESAPVA